MLLVMMENFRYCIWACVDPGHPWENYNNASRQGLHITVASHLPNLESALQTFNRIIREHNDATTTIFLDPGDPVSGTTPWRFNYLYFKAHVTSPQKPSWWPLNACISFYYSYGKEKFKNISRLFYNQKNIQKYNSAKITNFKLVCCRGHFNLHWLVVKEHFVLKQFL